MNSLDLYCIAILLFMIIGTAAFAYCAIDAIRCGNRAMAAFLFFVAVVFFSAILAGVLITCGGPGPETLPRGD